MTPFSRARILIAASACLLPLIGLQPAKAVIINVDGNSYDISVAITSYTANPAAFSALSGGQMPWWGDLILASRFASEAFDQLGSDLYEPGYGAVFAYALGPAGSGEINGVVQDTSDMNNSLILDSASPLAADNSYPYAFVQAASTVPVPGPVPLLGAVAAFGWARRIRSRTGPKSRHLNRGGRRRTP